VPDGGQERTGGGDGHGHQEVRWAIVPMKQGNACGGKGPG
jgi:hypothetical protein